MIWFEYFSSAMLDQEDWWKLKTGPQNWKHQGLKWICMDIVTKIYAMLQIQHFYTLQYCSFFMSTLIVKYFCHNRNVCTIFKELKWFGMLKPRPCKISAEYNARPSVCKWAGKLDFLTFYTYLKFPTFQLTDAPSYSSDIWHGLGLNVFFFFIFIYEQ